MKKFLAVALMFLFVFSFTTGCQEQTSGTKGKQQRVVKNKKAGSGKGKVAQLKKELRAVDAEILKIARQKPLNKNPQIKALLSEYASGKRKFVSGVNAEIAVNSEEGKQAVAEWNSLSFEKQQLMASKKAAKGKADKASYDQKIKAVNKKIGAASKVRQTFAKQVSQSEKGKAFRTAAMKQQQQIEDELAVAIQGVNQKGGKLAKKRAQLKMQLNKQSNKKGPKKKK